jgi:transposase InsO family protein
MSEERIHLPKLAEDGSNWIIYRNRITWTMNMRGLGDHLTSEKITKAYTDAGTVGRLSADQRWERDGFRASSILEATIPDDLFHKIQDTTTVKEVWEKLKAEYEGQSRSVMVDLGRKFTSTRCREDDNVCAHFTKLANICEKLSAIGRKVSDDEYVSVLVGSLPDCYDGPINSLINTCDATKTDLTHTAVIRAATREYEKRSLQKENQAQDEAYAAADAKSKKKDVECFNCKKRGHYKSECWAKGGGDEGGGPKKSSKSSKAKAGKGKDAANAAEGSDSSESGDESWAVIDDKTDGSMATIVEVDGASSEGEPCDQQSAFLTSSALTGSEAELYDSGASRHMSPFQHRFTNLRSIPPRPITAANNRVFYATGMGDLQIDVPNGSESTHITLRDALYAPEMTLTVISISKIASAGYSVIFKGKICKIKNKSGKTVGKIEARPNGLYRVDRPILAAAAAQESQVDILTAHRRLGHISADAIRDLARANAVTGLHIIDPSSTISCDSCEHAKATRKIICKQTTTSRAQAFGDEIYTDVWGPSRVETLGGRRYYITFTDDHTRFTKIQLLRTKDEAFAAYKAFAEWAKTQHGVRVKRLRSDRGGEYTSGEFSDFLKSQGTECRLTTHDTPQHNGVTESLNRRIFERVCAVRHHAQLPKTLWGEATHFIIWLKNRVITRALGKVTPHEQLYGTKPDFSNVPEWGQKVWVHQGSASKLDRRAAEVRWVGFDSDSTHAHRVYWQGKNRVSVEHDVRFVSTSVTVHIPSPLLPAHTPTSTTATTTLPPTLPTPTPTQTQVTSLPTPPVSTAAPQRTQVATPSTTTPSDVPAATDSGEEEIPDEEDKSPERSTIISPSNQPTPEPSPAPANPGTHKTTRISIPSLKAREVQAVKDSQAAAKKSQVTKASSSKTKKSSATSNTFRGCHPDYTGPPPTALLVDDEQTYVFHTEYDSLTTTDISSDPKSLAEAHARPDWPSWKAAMDKEIATLEAAKTWTTVLQPQGKNIVGSKWVFRIKRKSDGSIDKYKARLVARGFTQIYGVDYFDTYSPVAKMASFRLILAMAARYDWDVESFDFNGTYLNGTLSDDEEIYMKEPPGYETQGEHSVKRLQKSLYGLKQAGRKWYEALSRSLADLGFRATSADPGVFFAKNGDHILILAIHVDDCVLTGSSPSLITEYKSKFNACYTLTDLGPIHWFLGIKITRDRSAHTISLSQTSYIDSIIARFKLEDAKSFSTPMIPGVNYSRLESPSDATEAARMEKVPYREAIGSLMYVSVATCPDITHAVSALSRFLDNPGSTHWEAVKRVFRYLAGTRTFALTYGGDKQDLVGYTDADGASEEHRHAISGYAFLIDGGAVSWYSRKQEIVTLSTAEAKYVAATHAAKEAIWLRRLIFKLFPLPTTPTTIHCDNQAAIKLAMDDNYHARTKHIDIHYHFIRQVIAEKTIMLIYCPTDDMAADFLTKSLPKWKVSLHSCTLGLRRI